MVPPAASPYSQAQLQSIAGSRSLPAALVRSATIVLACAAGAANSAVAERFGMRELAVRKDQLILNGEPLILRAAAGECIEVTVNNALLDPAVTADAAVLDGTVVVDADGLPVFENNGQALDKSR